MCARAARVYARGKARTSGVATHVDRGAADGEGVRHGASGALVEDHPIEARHGARVEAESGRVKEREHRESVIDGLRPNAETCVGQSCRGAFFEKKAP